MLIGVPYDHEAGHEGEHIRLERRAAVEAGPSGSQTPPTTTEIRDFAEQVPMLHGPGGEDAVLSEPPPAYFSAENGPAPPRYTSIRNLV
jgi:hypothetical protein